MRAAAKAVARPERKPTAAIEVFIERDECETNFTIMPNELLNDRELSFAAKGLLSYIVSRPLTWRVHFEQLRHIGPKLLSLPTVRKLVAEIIASGYGCRTQIRDERQRIVGRTLRFSNRPKWRAVAAPVDFNDPDALAEAKARDSVSRFSVMRKDRATENRHPVVSNDRYKLEPPESPTAAGQTSVSQRPTRSTDPPEDSASPSHPSPEHHRPSEDSGPEIAEAMPSLAASAADGSARQTDEAGTDPPVRPDAEIELDLNHVREFDRLTKLWGRNIGARGPAWKAWWARPPEQREEAAREAEPFLASVRSHGGRVPKLAEYLATDPPLWKSIPPPKPVENKPHFVPKAEGGFQRFARERSEDVIESELGLRAANEGWIVELETFVLRRGRRPDAQELDVVRLDGIAAHERCHAEAARPEPDDQAGRQIRRFRLGLLERERRLSATARAAAEMRPTAPPIGSNVIENLVDEYDYEPDEIPI